MTLFVSTRFGISLLFASFGLVGCGASMEECDPAQGGFLRGIGCSASGAYGGRQQQRYGSLKEERIQREALRKEYREVSLEEEATRAERTALEGRYAALQRDLRSLQGSLQKSRGTTAGLAEQLERLKAETLTGRAAASVSNEQGATRLKELQRKRDALEREIEIALER